MKYITGFVAALLLVALLIGAGCTGTDEVKVTPQTTPTPTEEPTAAPVEKLVFGEENNGQTVSVETGAEITISLAENPTTGYSWNATTTDGLVIVKDEYKQDEAEAEKVGAGGVHTWFLKAEKAGKLQFEAINARPWENVTGNETTYELTFDVSGTAPAEEAVFGEDNRGETVNVKAGEGVTIKLAENPTTGYSWNATTTKGLVIVSDSYKQDDAPEGMVGVGGVHTWNLKADTPGVLTFSAVYARPWENITGNETAYDLTFIVSGTTPEGELVLGADENNQAIDVTKGAVISVMLAGNPTTGYTWNATTTEGLVITADEYRQNKAPEGMAGVGGVHTWHLKAEKSGTMQFDAEYARSWEKQTGDENTFGLTFNVK